ncbi:MAG: hypothetical protein EON55_10230 [Alphaproteobacteria bacterium]|nr:MAG: hypothetical protein EON55_10230 [Alphaproteobacteria bacterium]
MIIKFSTSVFLLTCLAGPALAQSASSPSPMLHGNYCGPGNNAPLGPIDALDAACARHDACTPNGALASKSCNLRLQQEAALIARDPRQPQDVKAMAGFVSVGAAMMPSDESTQTETVAMPPSEDQVRRPQATRRTEHRVAFRHSATRD